MKLLAIDFETSGQCPKENAPVSLGLAVMEGGVVAHSREWIIGPPRDKKGAITRAYDIRAMEIHGISWKSIKEAPSPSVVVDEVTKQLIEWDASELPRLAFNASFDYSFWETLLFLAGKFENYEFRLPMPPSIGSWHCARDVARRKLPNLSNHKLDTVIDHFGLKRSGEYHGALEDAVLAGVVYHELQRMEASS